MNPFTPRTVPESLISIDFTLNPVGTKMRACNYHEQSVAIVSPSGVPLSEVKTLIVIYSLQKLVLQHLSAVVLGQVQ